MHRLGAMTKSETRRILHRRSGHGRDYGSLAVDTIHQATGGHPWLIHLIAERLHANAPNSQQSIVTASDVQAALEACAHDTEGGLIEIWRALHPDERSVMFEIAHSSPDEEWVSVDDLRAALTRSKQYVTTSELASLLDRIHVGGLLIRTERHGQFLYQHAFPLFAHWCRG